MAEVALDSALNFLCTKLLPVWPLHVVSTMFLWIEHDLHDDWTEQV